MGMRGLARLITAILLTGGAGVTGACGSADSAIEDDGEAGCQPVDEDGGGVIPSRPDGPSFCPAGNVCNYQSQDGCAEGMACRPTLNAGQIVARCEMAGSGVPGDTCVNWTDCAPGYVCPDGRCRKLCCGRDWSESACDDGEACYREWFLTVAEGAPEDPDDDVIESTGAFLCYPSGCDVFTSDDCSSDRDCKIIDPRGTTACVPPSPEEEGERCTPPSVCGRGLSCVGDPGEERCRRLCRAEECGEPACDADDTCVHFNRDPPGVGECTPDWPTP
jgi:hypothetical protein